MVCLSAYYERNPDPLDMEHNSPLNKFVHTMGGIGLPSSLTIQLFNWKYTNPFAALLPMIDAELPNLKLHKHPWKRLFCTREPGTPLLHLAPLLLLWE